MAQSREKDWSGGDTFLRHYVQFQAVGGILGFVLLFVAAVVFLIQGHYWLGGGILGTLFLAGRIAFAVSRKTPRNPRRHAKAKQARKQHQA